MLLKVGKSVVPVSNSLDPDETQSYSASHPNPSCLHMALWLLQIGGIRDNKYNVYKIFKKKIVPWNTSPTIKLKSQYPPIVFAQSVVF